MLKIYLKNIYFNNNTISVHLAETINHYIIEQNVCGQKSKIKISKKRADSLNYSFRQYANQTSLISKIVDSTKFHSASTKLEVK
jgi:hypothetical protein